MKHFRCELLALIVCATGMLYATESPHFSKQELLDLLMTQPNNMAAYRAPTPPTGLTSVLGSVNFQGYNGGGTTPYTQGANITAYYGLSTPPTAGSTLPSNIIFSNVRTVNTAPTPCVFVGRNGNIGIGNFGPTNGGAVNAALHVEGDNSTGSAAASAANTMHIGPRTTALRSIVTSATGSMQVDGNTYVAQTTQTPGLTGYGVFSPVSYVPIRNATSPIAINDFPYTINAPGKYALYQDTSVASAPAITINSSDVILDLQGFELQTTVAGDSIVVNANTSNITIRNGKIAGNTAVSTSAIDASSTGHSNITFENIIVQGYRAQGIVINNCDGVFVNNVRVYNATLATSNTSSLGLNFCNFVRVSNVIIDGSGASGIICVGLNLNGVVNGMVTNVTVSNCTGSQTIPFRLAGAQYIVLKNCYTLGNTGTIINSFYDITGTSDTCQFYNCAGIGNVATTINQVFQALANCTLFDCIVDSNSTTDATGTTCTGFTLRHDSTAINCITSNTTSVDTTSTNAMAFTNVTTANNIGFINCTAFNNIVGNAASAGFAIDNSNQIFLRNCRSSNNPLGYTAIGASTTFPALENIATAYTTAFNNFPVGSNQTIATIGSLNTLAAQNPWVNTGVN